MSGDVRRGVAAKLLEVGGVRFGRFKLKLHEKDPNAPLSPVYLDLRVIRSFPELMDDVTDLYAEAIHRLRFDVLADVPTAGTPIAAVLAHKTRVPMITPRLRQKDYGRETKIEGVYQPGQVALVLDDLVTRAESKLEAIDVLRGNGLEVRDIVVLVDREQGGVQQLRLAGYACHAVFTFSELLRIYEQLGLVPAHQLAETRAYLESQRSSV
jgi:uridine monophosphate synthetase